MTSKAANISSTIDTIKDTVSSTTDDIEDTIKLEEDDMAYTAKDLKKQAYTAGIQLRKWVENVKGEASEAQHTAEKVIKERPFLSSLALFTVGIITARILSRK